MAYGVRDRVKNMDLNDEEKKRAVDVPLEKVLPDEGSLRYRREILRDIVAERLVDYFDWLKGVKVDRKVHERMQEMSDKSEIVSNNYYPDL